MYVFFENIVNYIEYIVFWIDVTLIDTILIKYDMYEIYIEVYFL